MGFPFACHIISLPAKQALLDSEWVDENLVIDSRKMMRDNLTHSSYVNVSCKLGFGGRWQIMEVSHMACYSLSQIHLFP